MDINSIEKEFYTILKEVSDVTEVVEEDLQKIAQDAVHSFVAHIVTNDGGAEESAWARFRVNLVDSLMEYDYVPWKLEAAIVAIMQRANVFYQNPELVPVTE
jgi:hypothetical protein